MSFFTNLVASLNPVAYWQMGSQLLNEYYDNYPMTFNSFWGTVTAVDTLIPGDTTGASRFSGYDCSASTFNNPLNLSLRNFSVIVTCNIRSFPVNSNRAVIFSTTNSGLYFTDNKTGVNFLSSAGSVELNLPKVEENKTLMVEMTWDSDLLTFKVYINNVEISSTPVPDSLTSFVNIYLGVHTGNYANVDIDDTFIFDRAITQEERTQLYNAMNLKFVRGSIESQITMNNWLLRLYRIDTGALVASESSVSGDYELAVLPVNQVPLFLTVLPNYQEAWSAASDIVLDDLIFTTHPDIKPYYYQCTQAGQTGTTEPVWPETVGETINDNNVIWECISRLIQPLTHSPMLPSE